MSETLSETSDMVIVKSVLLNARGRQLRHQHTSNVNSPVLQVGRAGHTKDMDVYKHKILVKHALVLATKFENSKISDQQYQNCHLQQ